MIISKDVGSKAKIKNNTEVRTNMLTHETIIPDSNIGVKGLKLIIFKVN